ncbi:MAG: hypothetical protein PHW04_02380 [Candidatus Wallbacteria bacterium]|nr:hypothetical protein [Candidatus Wallbacteria bacterium]
MKQIDVREGARRQHRTISLFAVIQCWIRGLDGVAFTRQSLQRLIGLIRFKGKREVWFKEDFKEFFPHIKTYYSKVPPKSFEVLIVSRLPLDDYLPNGADSTQDLIAEIAEGGPKIGVFQLWGNPNEEELKSQFEGLVPFFADSVNYDERLLTSYLALLVQGQVSPRSLLPMDVEAKQSNV